MRVIIGIDSTDSLKGGCTTYTLAKIVYFLLKTGMAKVISWPRLIRLNPNIPFKTRGNGAVSIKLETDSPHKVWNHIVEIVDTTAYNESYGVVMFQEKVPSAATELYNAALHKVIPVRYALKIAEETAFFYHTRGNKRGMVGAIAAAGAHFADRTWELLCYREKRFWGTPRVLDEKSVIVMDKKTAPYTFNNYDYKRKRILITPHGPDPVFYGIRASFPDILPIANGFLRYNEPSWGYIIFETNQGTDMHAIPKKINMCDKYEAAMITGVVASEPEISRGGHVSFLLNDETALAEVWVYEPTGVLRKTAILLSPGDQVSVIGGVRDRGKKGIVFNAEKIYFFGPVFLTRLYKSCPVCGSKRMKSKGQGIYKCKECGFKGVPNYIKKKTLRNLRPGWHYPDRSAYRHLTRPPERERLTSLPTELIDGWRWFRESV